MTTSIITQASEAGGQAFRNGQPCAPTLDEWIREATKTLPVGGGAAKIMRAWVAGWTRANLITED